MYRLICSFLILAVMGASASATPQESDTLIHKGASYSVLGFRFAPELSRKLYERTKKDERWISQSSLWRGYTAVLQVRDDKLYLVGIHFNCNEPRPSPEEILKFAIPDQGVFADFFSGVLFYGFGDTWGYMHNSSAGDQHKTIKKFIFEAGVLKSVTDIKTDKPMQLIQDRIMKDIEMLSETLRKVDPDDPFAPVKHGGAD
ncbi:MAG: hypothetical protein ACQKBY_09895 [Verrucomicrobiales bacterium]